MASAESPRRGFLGAVVLLTRHELAQAFGSRIAWSSAAVFGLLANALFMNEFFPRGVVDLTPWFEPLPLLLAGLLPAVTMRAFAEEQRQRTLEFLLTLPVRPVQVWVAKFLASLAQATLFLTSALPLVLLLVWLGDPDLGRILGGLVGSWLLAGLLIGIGLCCSAFTRDQVLAFVGAALIGLALLLLGEPATTAVLDGWWPRAGIGTFLAEHISALPRFERAVEGRIDVGSVLYFGGGACWFALLGAAALERRRA